MIFPDINLLLYAQNTDAPQHQRALEWWENCLNSQAPVSFSWVTLLGYVRIATNPRFAKPLSVKEALETVEGWLSRSHIQVKSPGPKYWSIYSELIRTHQLLGGSQTDAHLAAIAIEHELELYSSDEGFSRFNGLKWKNPLDID